MTFQNSLPPDLLRVGISVDATGTTVAKQGSVIQGMFNQTNYQLGKAMLDAAQVRHEALACNLANVETRNYKRVDIAPDFQAQLRAAVGTGDASRISRVHAKIVSDDTTVVTRGDGNNVELDKELMEINRNALEYEFLTQYMTSRFTSLRAAISGKAD